MLATIKRDPAAPKTPLSPPPPGEAIPGLAGKSVPRQHPHLYVYGTNGPPEAVAAARALASGLADWGPMIAAKFAVKSDREVTADDRARFNLVLVGAAPFNTLAGELAVPMPDARPLGDRAFRAQVARSARAQPVRAGLRRPHATRIRPAAALRAPQPGRLDAREQPPVHDVRQLGSRRAAGPRACELVSNRTLTAARRTKQCRQEAA